MRNRCRVGSCGWQRESGPGRAGAVESPARGAEAEVAGMLGKGTQGSLCPIESPVITILTFYGRLSPGAYSSTSINCLS